jgi:hypothetical protein
MTWLLWRVRRPSWETLVLSYSLLRSAIHEVGAERLLLMWSFSLLFDGHLIGLILARIAGWLAVTRIRLCQIVYWRQRGSSLAHRRAFQDQYGLPQYHLALELRAAEVSAFHAIWIPVMSLRRLILAWQETGDHTYLTIRTL